MLSPAQTSRTVSALYSWLIERNISARALIAWRSAKIINSLLRRNVYDVDDDLPLVDWRSEPEVPLGAQVRA